MSPEEPFSIFRIKSFKDLKGLNWIYFMSLGKMRLALVSLSVLILAALVVYSDPPKLLSIISRSDAKYLLLAFLLSNAAILARVGKWAVLLDGVKFSSLIPVQLLGVTISNLSPGKIAEPAKALILKMRTKVNVSESLPSIIWERVLDILVLVFLAFSVFQMLALSGRFLFLGAASIAAFLLIVSVLLAALKIKRISYRVFYSLRKLPLANRIDEKFLEMFYGQKVKAKSLFASLLLTLLAWILDGLVFYFAFRSIGIDVNPFIIAGLIALATLVGIISFLPGGIGSMEISLLVLLNLQGIGGAAALSGVLLSRFLSLWYSMFLGGLSFLYLSRKLDIGDVLR